MGVAMSVNGLASLSVDEVADILADSPLFEYRQACVDFGIDGDMLVRLPADQLANALIRAGVDDKQHLEFLLDEINKIRCPRIDPSKLDRRNLRELLSQSDSLDWDEHSDTSEWSGVSLDSENRILGLNIANRNVSGELPAALGELSNLEYLHAPSNLLTGSIPDAIGGLNRLSSLKLGHNRLSGRLPSSLTRLASLTALDLAWNKITGTIPMKIGMMTSLRHLNLGMNKLNGAIPRELGSLHLLVELRLRENTLSGKIPPLLSNMRSLQVLDLMSNELQGHIPESLGGLTDLRELWLGGNRLIGGIPETLSTLDELQSLQLSRNKLAGKIQPRVLSALAQSLVYLDLSHNAFEGELPLAALVPHMAGVSAASGDAESGSPPDGHGSRSGTRGDVVPTAAAVYSSLSYINLSHNKFTGGVPEEVGELTSLDTLDVSHNKLEGVIPPDIGNCVALRVLSFSRCGLSGRLDEETGEGLGRLRSMETLRLDANTFEGSVPAALGNLTRLEVLQLQCNCFSGYLPWTLGQLDRLWALTVRDNNLSGRIPGSLGRLTRLRSFRLDENRSLRGPIPASLASRPDCTVRADERVLEDTEAVMLGSKLDDWFLVPRKAFLNLQEFPGYTAVRPSLIRHVSTVVPYECHVFNGAKGRRIIVRRKEIAFFSHCWELPPDQCPPKPGLLDGPHPDTPDRTKLRHMKACLEGAPPSVEYVWVDMLCVPLGEWKRRRAAGRSIPFFVQNSGRFYILSPDSASLERHKKRAWCRLEALCAACPYQPCQLESAFSAKPVNQNSAATRFVYDAVEVFISTWEKGARHEARLSGSDELEAAGFLDNPVWGKLSDPEDREDVAEAALEVVNVMEISGRIDAALAKIARFSAKRVLYGSQGWEGQDADEEEVPSLYTDKTGSGGSGAGGSLSTDGHFSRRKRGLAPPKGAAALRISAGS